MLYLGIIYFVVCHLCLVKSFPTSIINVKTSITRRRPLVTSYINDITTSSSSLYATSTYTDEQYTGVNGVIGRIGDWALDATKSLADLLSSDTSENSQTIGMQSPSVNAALIKIQKDMNILDEVAGQTPQLTRLELALLATTVAVSASAPSIFTLRVVEVLVPSMAAVAAALGISAEYTGKVAVSNGKEVAAVAIQAAAEADLEQ